MERHTFFILIGLLLHINCVYSIWVCARDEDCSSLSGSVCNSGVCACAPGQQAVLGGSVCTDVAPYLSSPCREDHQCARLFTGFQCRLNANSTEGNCFCRSGFHYLRGRCWRSIDFGAACSRDEECMGLIRDPFSLQCTGTCQCADGYDERQRGHCRMFGTAAGDSCVIDQDCQFPDSRCDLSTLRCLSNNSTEITLLEASPRDVPLTTSYTTTVRRVECNDTNPCADPFQCSSFGVCICPLGYYESTDGRTCLAELGSPSTASQCDGLLSEVRNGICLCQSNFFYEENMRDCIRVTRRISESCISDYNCHTFGPGSRCGVPQEPWGLRSCECKPELAVWDAERGMCRFFSGVGGICEVDSDCQAGQLEIQCVKNEEGQGICSCPDDMTEYEGLCLASGLGLGDECQHTLECTGTSNIVCSAASQRCECAEGYQAVGDICAPIIGGSCVEDSDCAIENTVCTNTASGFTCQCRESFVEYNDVCWPGISGFNATCSVTAQCVAALGDSSSCVNSLCTCAVDYHYRDGRCWPISRLFERCSRSSQCYLPNDIERVVCRNSRCQCDFRFPFSEELQTCLPSSATTFTASIVLITSLFMINR